MKYPVFVFLLLLSSSAFAQLERSEGNQSERYIGREKNSIGKESHSLKGKRHIGKGFSTSKDKKTLLGQPDKRKLELDNDEGAVDMSEKNDYVTRKSKFAPDYLQKRKRENNKYAHSKPQDLGEFSTDGNYVMVSWRDSQVVDGDRVDVLVNGEVVVRNTTLLARYRTIRIDLEKGFTKIEFKALNQGDSGPNTADFKVEDEYGTVLTHNQWNLTTGTKAHLVVVKN